MALALEGGGKETTIQGVVIDHQDVAQSPSSSCASVSGEQSATSATSRTHKGRTPPVPFRSDLGGRMSCSECGTDNEAGRKFCKECGAPLALVCPSCGASNSGDSKFCGECGSTLAATATTDPDRRADDRATLRLGAVRRPRRVHDALGAPRRGGRARAARPGTSTRLGASIERHGGIVEKFIGDAVMAVWGTPVAHEDDAERAVRSALELVDAVQALGPGRSRPAGSRRRADRRGGGHRRRRPPGDGHRRLVNTASRCSRPPSRARCWSARQPSEQRPARSRSRRSERSP